MASSLTINPRHPRLYDKDGNPIDFELRCAYCLRGLCQNHVYVTKLKTKDRWGIFVGICGQCKRDIKAGREPVPRHDRRQIDRIEDGEYEGFEFMGWKSS